MSINTLNKGDDDDDDDDDNNNNNNSSSLKSAAQMSSKPRMKLLKNRNKHREIQLTSWFLMFCKIT
jgi:hypothetical protein